MYISKHTANVLKNAGQFTAFKIICGTANKGI